MKNYFNRAFMILAMLFVSVTYTGAYLSDSVAVSGNTFTAGVWDSGPEVVLNEAMVNPANESGSNPNGEWIEIVNVSSTTVDVNGWIIEDSVSNSYVISATNTNTGTTTIAAGEYLAVYKNGVAIFNNGGDSINLYDLSSNLIDDFSYSSSTDDVTWSRVPDAIGSWSDGHIPTPGGPNV